jgi:hypothetical protein
VVLALDGTYRPSNYGYTREQIADALREVAQRLGRSPRKAEYIAIRTQLQREEESERRPVKARPSTAVIGRAYEIWDDALTSAGLEPLGGRGTRSQPRHVAPRYGDAELLDAVRRCLRDLGVVYVKRRAYVAWHDRQPNRDAIPSADTINERFGCWDKLVRRARDGDA